MIYFSKFSKNYRILWIFKKNWIFCEFYKKSWICLLRDWTRHMAVYLDTALPLRYRTGNRFLLKIIEIKKFFEIFGNMLIFWSMLNFLIKWYIFFWYSKNECFLGILENFFTYLFVARDSVHRMNCISKKKFFSYTKITVLRHNPIRHASKIPVTPIMMYTATVFCS